MVRILNLVSHLSLSNETHVLVARHLSTMSLTAEPPTFAQPSYYTMHRNGHPQPNPPPPYTEYAQELAYMNSNSSRATESSYWTNTRDNAVQMLNHPNGP
jgi:cohesin loading factor subunit SCC2